MRLSSVNSPVTTFIQPPRTYLQNNTAAFSNFGTVFGIDPKIQVPRTEQYSIGAVELYANAHTGDLGGSASTRVFTDALVARIAAA